jgi:anti-sigma B factor antagonist
VTIQVTSRQADGVTVVDLSGSITSEGGSQDLRNKVKDLSDQGSKNIVLNFAKVERVDSAGIGELISAYTMVRNAGGDLKLFNLTREVHDLLQITKLCTVFDIQHDEASAIEAFQSNRGAAVR